MMSIRRTQITYLAPKTVLKNLKFKSLSTQDAPENDDKKDTEAATNHDQDLLINECATKAMERQSSTSVTK